MYEGTRRSSSEVAVIETDGTIIAQADDSPPGDYDEIEVLPGLRVLSLKLSDHHPVNPNNDWLRRTSQESVAVCFIARRGHTYTARPVYAGKTWRGEIIDQQTTERVPTEGFADVNERCEEAPGKYRQSHRIPVPGIVPIIIPH